LSSHIRNAERNSECVHDRAVTKAGDHYGVTEQPQDTAQQREQTDDSDTLKQTSAMGVLWAVGRRVVHAAACR